MRDFNRGESINRLIDAAYAGRLDRRDFCKALVAAGVTAADWGYKSTPQAHLNNRVIVAPVGKIIGGGSSINATVWLKGDKADYDAWEAAAGPGWGFDAIVRNFKKAERYAGGESTIRGG